MVTAFYLALSPLLSTVFYKILQLDLGLPRGRRVAFRSTSLSGTLQGVILGMKKYILLAKILFVSRFAMVLFAIGLLFYDHSVGIAILAWIIFNAAILLWILAQSLEKFVRRKRYFQLRKYSEICASARRGRSDRGFCNIVRYSPRWWISESSLSRRLRGCNDDFRRSGDCGSRSAYIRVAAGSFDSKSVGDASYGVRLALKFTMLAILPASLLVAGVSSQLLDIIRGQADRTSREISPSK